ncbi:putative aliphatic sulfonates import ATP-binding protein SsuB [Advenella mimigardefordensis DPN7]|uniref:Putative aliphatic sulfonates import ATP-binding protein SsuB n=1 Tax=Advenella mimigardefordensis (strain DSM 17166 / LMG 22922 / DPN7) TaxID=1247726 RepID=W0PFX7_ADVMD|nr:ABC transporter ATP-binding protein [Advenella mimigardefordensis]AHG65596.1 putative aliphatic sulfonates import ATP-binding protein SsuB [Advenella mimigardefordensis DPN7]
MAQFQFRQRGDDTVTATGSSAASATSSPVHLEAGRASNDLDIIGLGKRYASQQASGGVLQVLDNINLTVPAGQFVSIVGASGCGKSTLLRLILGLDSEFEGQILTGGQAVVGTSRERGIVFQDHRLFPWLTVAQNVGVALRNAPFNAAQKRDLIAEHIALVGLEGFEQSYPHQISGGMAQRVAIARGLVNRPRILLLDEPFGALDALTRSRLQVELQDIWQKEQITMLLVTHDVDEAVFLGDQVVVMQPHPGRIRRTVPVDLPRQRNRSDPRFIQLRDDVLSDFLDFDPNEVDKPARAVTSGPYPRSLADLAMAW